MVSLHLAKYKLPARVRSPYFEEILMISFDNWKCGNCGHIGPCEYTQDNNSSEFWGQPVAEILMVDMCCAECGSEDVEES